MHEEQARPKVHRRERALVRERQQVPVLTVLGVTAVIGLAVMLLLSYVQLTTLAADTVTLRSELSDLQAENVTLTAPHEQMFDMKSQVALSTKYSLRRRTPLLIWIGTTSPHAAVWRLSLIHIVQQFAGNLFALSTLFLHK